MWANPLTPIAQGRLFNLFCPLHTPPSKFPFAPSPQSPACFNCQLFFEASSSTYLKLPWVNDWHSESTHENRSWPFDFEIQLCLQRTPLWQAKNSLLHPPRQTTADKPVLIALLLFEASSFSYLGRILICQSLRTFHFRSSTLLQWLTFKKTPPWLTTAGTLRDRSSRTHSSRDSLPLGMQQQRGLQSFAMPVTPCHVVGNCCMSTQFGSVRVFWLILSVLMAICSLSWKKSFLQAWRCVLNSINFWDICCMNFMPC